MNVLRWVRACRREHDLTERAQPPADASNATTSPSTIASLGPSPARRTSTTSGNCVLTRSSRRVNSSIRPSAILCAWTRTSSYLYSATHLAAQLGQDLHRVGQPLGEHGPHSVTRAHLQLLDRRHPASDQNGGDLAQIAADVVGAFQHRPGGPPTGVYLRERVQDGGHADAQPQSSGDQAQQVADLQRGSLGEVAGLPHASGDLPGAGAGRGADRADGELLGQAGELWRDQALAQVTDRGQQPGRGPGAGQPDGRSAPASHRPAPGHG